MWTISDHFFGFLEATTQKKHLVYNFVELERVFNALPRMTSKTFVAGASTVWVRAPIKSRGSLLHDIVADHDSTTTKTVGQQNTRDGGVGVLGFRGVTCRQGDVL